VGELLPSKNTPDVWEFTYHLGSPDFEAAKDAGFKGYPAFRLDDKVFASGVREAFMRRLPPRNRGDFDAFLKMHKLPVPFTGSDLALLGYTGGRLPSDGFGFVPEFGAGGAPCQYILEIAGVRHVFGHDLSSVEVGDAVDFRAEPENPIDSDAIAADHCGRKLGYVNRAMLGTFSKWLSNARMTATIERLNGKPDRPLVYVRVNVDC
jgi:hypothetical protein